MDPDAVERSEGRGVEHAVGDAGRDDDRSGREGRAVGELDDAEVAFDAQGDDVAAVDHLGSEQDRLVERARSELGAADAPREPEVVADQRARAGLSAHRRPFDEGDAQSF